MTPDLDDALRAIAEDARAVLAAPAVSLGMARPPSTSGVYVLSVAGTMTYIGGAKGSGGLYDRLKNKHMSGDDNHAIQRAFLVEFPDRLLRRSHIRTNVFAQWLEIPDTDRMLAVERVLIWLHRPPWNRM